MKKIETASRNKHARQKISTRGRRQELARKRLPFETLEDRQMMAILYWDTNGATAGLGGTGNWDSATANWSTNAAGNIATTTWVAGSDAVFSGTAGTATITTTGISANSVQINVADTIA